MSETAAAFDALRDEYFSVWLRYHPDLAIEVGVPGYAHLLPAQSDDELAALGGWLETLVVALEELDYAELDRERQIDLRLMFGAAQAEHRELLERDWRHRDPLRFLPVGEIYRLTQQPSDDLRDALVGLLESVPEYLRLAVAHLRPMAELIPPELLAAAVDEIKRGRCYLRELEQSPWLRRSCRGWSQIEFLLGQACSALSAFGDSLSSEIATRAAGQLGCGEGHLRLLFRHRHFLEIDPDAARSALTQALETSREMLSLLCSEMGLAPGDAWRHLGAQRIEPEDWLGFCWQESEGLEAFVRQTGLFSLPEADLNIRVRPSCPRPQRFATDYVADRKARRGTFFVRASGETNAAAEPRSRLRARCLAGTWGGSHLLTFAADDAGWRLPRRLCAGGGFAAAWGLYLRERLIELGYLDDENRLLALLQRASSIELALLDLDIHLGLADGPQARERLDKLPLTTGSDLVYLARHPGSAVAGVLGWQTILDARAASMSRERDRFSERAFHDRLLGCGPIPLSLALPPGATDAKVPAPEAVP